MVVICLGPVCIPLWPVIALTLKPIWDRFVPDDWKEYLSKLWNRLIEFVCGKRKAYQKPSMRDTVASGTPAVQNITTLAEFEAVMADSHKRPVIIKFTADFCGPCKLISPHYELHAIRHHSKVGFHELDIERLDSVALELGVSSIPAFHVYVSGKKKAEVVGGNVEKLDRLIKDSIALV
jgi:thioredoxin 1